MKRGYIGFLANISNKIIEIAKNDEYVYKQINSSALFILKSIIYF